MGNGIDKPEPLNHPHTGCPNRRRHSRRIKTAREEFPYQEVALDGMRQIKLDAKILAGNTRNTPRDIAYVFYMKPKCRIDFDGFAWTGDKPYSSPR